MTMRNVRIVFWWKHLTTTRGFRLPISGINVNSTTWFHVSSRCLQWKKNPSLNTSFVNPFTYLTNISKQDARFFFSQSGADWGHQHVIHICNNKQDITFTSKKWLKRIMTIFYLTIFTHSMVSNILIPLSML